MLLGIIFLTKGFSVNEAVAWCFVTLWLCQGSASGWFLAHPTCFSFCIYFSFKHFVLKIRVRIGRLCIWIKYFYKIIYSVAVSPHSEKFQNYLFRCCLLSYKFALLWYWALYSSFWYLYIHKYMSYDSLHVLVYITNLWKSTK